MAGWRTQQVHVAAPLAETNVVGAILKPWGAAALFDLTAAEIQNRAVDLDAVWDQSVESLRDRLSGAGMSSACATPVRGMSVSGQGRPVATAFPWVLLKILATSHSFETTAEVDVTMPVRSS